MIKMIWAMDENFLIGKDNLIPWHIKEDLVYYRKQTAGQTVIMGEQTYYSLKGYYKTKPLPYGKIYVCSVNNIQLEDAIIVSDLIPFLENLEEDVFVVGGKTIYQLALPYADMLYISFIKGTHEGNVYFPKIDFEKYDLVSKNETEQVIYTIYKRK